AQLPKGQSLFAGEKGIEIFTHEQFKLILPAKSIPLYEQLLRMRMNKKGDLLTNYIFGNALFFTYDPIKNEYEPPVKLLAGIRVNEAFFDNEQNLWLCTAGSGIYKLSKKS